MINKLVLSVALSLSLLALLVRSDVADNISPPEFEQPPQQEQNFAQRTYRIQKGNLDKVGLDYGNIQSYSFVLKYPEEYIVAVETDQTVKAILFTYRDVDNTYVEATPEQGQEIRIIIYENRRVVVFNEMFYNRAGFSFSAKKGQEYLIQFYNSGNDKLIVMHMENFLTYGKTSDIVSKEQIGVHEVKSKSILQKFKTYLSIAEINALFNEHIAAVVKVQTDHYMIYQVAEMLLVTAATIAQIYFIRKLLSNSSSII